MLASLGGMLGVKLDPMAHRYMSQNDMAKMATQFARQDQQIANTQAFKASEAEKQRQFMRELTSMKLANGLAVANARAGAKGSGGGSSSGLMSSDKSVEKIASDFNGFLQENAEKETFTQGDLDALNRNFNDAVLRLSSAQDTPYAREVLSRMVNDYNYQVEHLQNSVSGNKLDYRVSQEVMNKLGKKE